MNRRAKLIFAGIFAASSLALVGACAASGVSESSDDSSNNGGDSSTQGTDGSPVFSDSAVPDSASNNDSGSEVDSGCAKAEGAACAVFPNCGCNGTTCDFPSDGGAELFCEGDSGAATSGEPCTTSEDCVAGETCLFSKCRTYCGTLGVDCPDPKLSACRAHGTVPGDYVCGIRCDLTSPTSCGAPSGCVVLAAGSSSYTTECEPVGDAGVGATCVVANDCAPSLVCIDFGGGTLTCQQRCTPTGVKGSCTTGTCTAESTALTIDGVDYGYCH